MKKKLLSAALAAVMVLSCTACGNNSSAPASNAPASTPTSSSTNIASVVNSGESQPTNADCIIGNIPCEMPISKDGLTLNVMWRFSGVTGNYKPEDVTFWKEYEKLSGIHINFTDSSADRTGMTQKALVGGEDYDLICKNKISQSSLIEYGQQGLIKDLAPLLPQYAPNIWAYLQNHPDTLGCVQSPEGNIWAIPYVLSGAELRVSRKAWINKTWLDNLGLSIPKTTDELYNVLKAFKEKDANGNGDPNDEIPLSTDDYAAVQDILYGAFGIGNRGTHNMDVDWDEKNNCARLIGISDEYKEYLQYLNKLYTEGLLDQEIFDMGKTWTVKQADNRIGLFAHTSVFAITNENGCEWVGLSDALEGPHGSKIWTPIRANFHSTGNAIMPEGCTHVEEALRWLDYLWTDEGALLFFYGVEGDTCVKNDDGSYSYTDSVLAPMNDGQSFDACAAAVTPFPGGANPCVAVYPYFAGGETQEPNASVARSLFELRAPEIWPVFTFTADENSTLAPILSDITKTIDEAATAFVIGNRSFSEWDAYVQSIKAMGADTMLSIYTNAINRYNALVK